MIKEIHMPKLSPKSDEYFFGGWDKKVGDTVKKGDVLFEVETEKVTSQVQSDEDGVLKETKAETGETVKAGDVIGTIEVQ